MPPASSYTLTASGCYKFGSGVVPIGVPSQCGGHGNGLGRGVGVALVWARITAAMLMAAMNNSKQRISLKSPALNFILGSVVISKGVA